MWLSFWRSRQRFSLDELRYLTEQLQKVQTINEVNKDFVIEALRSIAELVTYGDQHDSAYFDFFMEKEVMGEFVRLLDISKTTAVSLQLLQTVSIMIQNLRHEHAIHYLFSNEHINYLITYSFDFQNEELLSHYISFLRAISGKLDSSTISLLVKTENNEVVSFPLYVEALKFAFHEESMIRIAVRAMTLNVYHVGDDGINRYITSGPLANYFPDLVDFLKKQCISLNKLVCQASTNQNQVLLSSISSAVDEIEDDLFYLSDVISAGIPDVGRLITDNLLRLLILPLLLPSLTNEAVNDVQIGAVTSMYLLCCILRIVKIKDLANTVAAALFCPPGVFKLTPESSMNGHSDCPLMIPHANSNHHGDEESHQGDVDANHLKIMVPENRSSIDKCSGRCPALREYLLSYLANGNDVQVMGSFSVFAVLLQTKELDESMLEGLGILPQRKQHKKHLLQSLVGESWGEEQLFASENSFVRYSASGELESCLRKLKEQYGAACSSVEMRSSPRLSRFQVLDAIIHLFSRTDISADVLCNVSWLLRQLLPYNKAEVDKKHLELLTETYAGSCGGLLQEVRGVWADQLVSVISDEWRKCKRVVEASFPPRELKYLLNPVKSSYLKDVIPSESSFADGEKMCKLAKKLVILYQLQLCFHGKTLPENPPLLPPGDVPEKSRAVSVGIENSDPRPGSELKLGDAIPCRIAFERGKERHFSFLAVSKGVAGWLFLLEELPLKQNFGVIRLMAPLAGSNPRADEKHPKWLHLRIRPSTLSILDSLRSTTPDGRWTLAFRDEESSKSSLSMVLEELSLQHQEVERRVKPLLNLQSSMDCSGSPLRPEASSTNL